MQFDRPCHYGPCTEKGIATKGFCKCAADAKRIAELEAALAQISSLARFELKTPTQLHETCLHMIAKAARAMPTTPNDYVRVKLTEAGRKILRAQRKALIESYPNSTLGGDGIPNEDEDGWSRWQLWWLISTFGETHAGSQMPFDDFEIEQKK